MSQFQIRLRRRNVPDDEILEDMRQTANALQSASLTALQYDQCGAFGVRTALRRFGTWNAALEKARLSISNRQHIPNEELFENIANVWTKLGQQPLGRHMSDKSAGSSFSKGTYEKRFGSWNNALLAFSNYVQSGMDSFESQGPSDTDTQSSHTARRRTPRELNWRLRAKVLIKHSCICQMCGDGPAKSPHTALHVDHILAWANGGETVEENLQTLCEKCNIGKSDQLLPGQGAR